MSPTTDAEEAERALAQWRDTTFADLVLIVLGLAAQQRPLELRHALGSVFDLSAVEKALEVSMARAEKAERDCAEARERFAALQQSLDTFERRIERLNYDLEVAEQRLAALNQPRNP